MRRRGALQTLALPDSVRVVSAALAFTDAAPQLRVAYAAPRPLPPEAETMLARQAADALALPPETVTVARAPETAKAPETGTPETPADSTAR